MESQIPDEVNQDEESDLEQIALRGALAALDRYSTIFSGRHTDDFKIRLSGKLRRRVAVEDVVQEVRIAAHEQRADFRGESLEDLYSWLRGIADNKVRQAVVFHGNTARRAVGREVIRSIRFGK